MIKQYTVHKNHLIDSIFYHSLQSLVGRNYWRAVNHAIRSGRHPFTHEALPVDTIYANLIGRVLSITVWRAEAYDHYETPGEFFSFVCLVDEEKISFLIPTKQATLTGEEIGELFRFSWTDNQLVMEKVVL